VPLQCDIFFILIQPSFLYDGSQNNYVFSFKQKSSYFMVSAGVFHKHEKWNVGKVTPACCSVQRTWLIVMGSIKMNSVKERLSLAK